jgi:hypothetical protein
MTVALLRQIEPQEADVAGEPYHRAARRSFEFFRCLMRPQLISGWWVREVCGALQEFYEDLISGRRPKLAIGAPPQHATGRVSRCQNSPPLPSSEEAGQQISLASPCSAAVMGESADTRGRSLRSGVNLRPVPWPPNLPQNPWPRQG